MSYMGLSGADYFENIGKYRSEAEGQMNMYRSNALEQLQDNNNKITKQIEAVQKAGAGITALGMATKTLSKKLPQSMFEGVKTVGDTGKSSISGYLESTPSFNKNNFNPFEGYGNKSFSSQVNDAVSHNGDRLVGDGLDNSQAGRPLYSGREAEPTPSKNLTKDVPPDAQIDATNDRINKMDNDDEFQDPAPRPAEARDTAGLEDNTEVSVGGRGRTVETDLPQIDTTDTSVPRETEIDNSAIDDGGRASRRAGLDELDPTGNPSPYEPKEAPSEIEPAPTEPATSTLVEEPSTNRAEGEGDKGTQEESFENQASLDAEGENITKGGMEGVLDGMKNDLPALVGEEGGLGGADLAGLVAGGGEMVGAGLLLGGLAYEMIKSKSMASQEQQVKASSAGMGGGGGGANTQGYGSVGGAGIT